MLTLTAIAATVATLAIGLVVTFDQPVDRIRSEPLTSATEVTRLSAELIASKRQVDRLQAQVARLARPTNSGRLGARVAGIDRRLAQLSADFQNLESAVLDNPAKAVRVTLLQRDLATVRSQNEAQLDNVRADVDRQYDLMKWILGTLVVGLIGLIVTVVVPAVRRSPE